MARKPTGYVSGDVNVRATSVQIEVPASEFDELLQAFIDKKMSPVKKGLVRNINISLEGDVAVFTITDQPPAPEPPVDA